MSSNLFKNLESGPEPVGLVRLARRKCSHSSSNLFMRCPLYAATVCGPTGTTLRRWATNGVVVIIQTMNSFDMTPFACPREIKI